MVRREFDWRQFYLKLNMEINNSKNKNEYSVLVIFIPIIIGLLLCVALIFCES